MHASMPVAVIAGATVHVHVHVLAGFPNEASENCLKTVRSTVLLKFRCEFKPQKEDSPKR